jgi:nucleoid-associated protein YgaU
MALVLVALVGAAGILLWQNPELRPWRGAQVAAAQRAIAPIPPQEGPVAAADAPAPPAPAPIIATSAPAHAPNAARCPAAANGAMAVTVQPGDTLSEIALTCYGRAGAWPALVRCNGFLMERNLSGVSPLHGGDLLYVGDRLVLPAPGGQCA